MRTIIILIFVLSSVNFAFAEEKFPTGDFSAMTPAGKVTVTQIIAPDTIGVSDGRIIHLTGLDFPDLWVKDGPGTFAQTAKRVLNDMLLGKDIRLYQTKKKDTGRINRMGHDIMHIERVPDNAWIQGTMITLGLARVQTFASNNDMAKQMLALEDQARKNKSGLWAVADYAVLTPETITDRHLNHFQIVEGTVKKAALNKNRLYLNFGDDWRSDFTVSITPENKRAFTKRGIDPLQWNGKRVRVRGWLEFYNGPNIEIDHPEGIEILTNSP